MRHDDPLRDDEQLVDRAIRRAFEAAPELSPQDDDGARTEAAIARALQARQAGGAKPPARSVPRTVYLVAATLCVGALAYAAVQQRSESVPDAPAETAPPTVSTNDHAGTNVGAAEPVPSSVPVLEAVTPESLPTIAPSARSMAPAPAVTTARRTGPAAETLGAAELFARANDARRANETKRAIALYEELQERFPETREASTSRVALGRLLLDRTGDPARARALFGGYLAREPSGPLAEEARAGRALAAMRLGDREAERAAWNELLERHPGSVHAERARQRLSELGN